MTGLASRVGSVASEPLQGTVLATLVPSTGQEPFQTSQAGLHVLPASYGKKCGLATPGQDKDCDCPPVSVNLNKTLAKLLFLGSYNRLQKKKKSVN